MFLQLAKSCFLVFFPPKHVKLKAVCSPKDLWVILLSIVAEKAQVEVTTPTQGQPAGYPTKDFANAWWSSLVTLSSDR